jgi:hypothetical protein
MGTSIPFGNGRGWGFDPSLSKDAFIAAVLQERSWELFAEADRWFDLTRTNTFLTVIPKAVNDVYPTRTRRRSTAITLYHWKRFRPIQS